MSGGQYGEDRLLKLFFREQKEGFIVDVGAANGQDNSNSYMLLQHPGWKGILIEPEPSQFSSLHILYDGRPGVRCVNSAVGARGSKGTLYCGGQVSTMLPETKARCEEAYGIEYTETEVVLQSLTGILITEEAPPEIDFMSIDCEGMDWEVWTTLDQEKFSPRLVCMEGSGYTMYGYQELCRVGGNTFYIREDQSCI